MKVLHTQGVIQSYPALEGSKSVSAGLALRQRLQQRLRILQVSRIKTLGEPMVDWCQEVMGFLAFPLLLPQAGEAHRCTQLQGFGLLAASHVEGLLEARLGVGLIPTALDWVALFCA